MGKLIGMTDFVLEQREIYVNDRLTKANIGLHVYLSKTSNYANFLKQPLELWMFVPCGENGNVLELPHPSNYNMQADVAYDLYNEDIQVFMKAKERVLFEGFEIKDGLSVCDENSIIHVFWNYENIWKLSKGISTIEDLVKYNLTLTQTAKNKIL